MNSKTAKDIIIGKWGLKSGSSRRETDLEKYKQENAALRKSMEEVVKGKGKMTDAERNGLLEKILSLEKEKENHNCLLGEKDKEIQNLKDKLRSKNKNSEVSLLQSQLEEKTKEAERREQLLCSLSEEMNRLKCNLSSVTAKCSELENRASTSKASQVSTENCLTGSLTNLYEVEKQLKDALEKNQQWLLYDQQREAYVRGLLGRIFELEQKSETVSQQESKEFNSEGHLQEEKQKYYDQLLLTAKNDLETERRTITQLRSELNEFKKKYEETQREITTLNALLQSQQVAEMKTLENENKIKGEKVQRLKQENETIKGQLREEKKKSEDLLCQVQLLRKSLLKQQEEHTRIALLEQQIQICTTDFENEKLDRQNLQHQLNKVLKELRKAREQITRLEPLKPQESGRMEPQEDLQAVFEEKLTMYDRSPSLKHSNLLDESFLECPRCKAQYPTSQHRELLAHIDFCTA
ncbi:PREDICTED: centrosomal protein of 55 kDa [Haliaeetus leucocephalus]|uniref:centrosomal protein of 55 kDa n=1 Tax=Haliaeetus leucocephalus TaxID=52644 RepID=UPI000522C1EE|nr:PREDICTED: centrosomal protein of 55 kDa [Haliaeetus albicilla]XP_010563231.1 PREDICTED: centrosomal protein of 55 kDa [Haliaeetus leucocephalus]